MGGNGPRDPERSLAKRRRALPRRGEGEKGTLRHRVQAGQGRVEALEKKSIARQKKTRRKRHAKKEKKGTLDHRQGKSRDLSACRKKEGKGRRNKKHEERE